MSAVRFSLSPETLALCLFEFLVAFHVSVVFEVILELCQHMLNLCAVRQYFKLRFPEVVFRCSRHPDEGLGFDDNNEVYGVMSKTVFPLTQQPIIYRLPEKLKDKVNYD